MDFTVTEVVQKGNTLRAKLSFNNSSSSVSFSTKMSPEFVIMNAAVFQMRFSVYQARCEFNNQVFVRFNKRRRAGVDEDLNYTIKFTSTELKITNKCFSSDDGTWHFIHENKMREFTFNVVVHMELIPNRYSCRLANSFASLHEDTELKDFELRGEDGSVRMHRVVLAAASPVLRRMLAGEWRETVEGHVDVTGTSKASLEHFKNYLYLHTLPESGLEQLLLLSSYYMMPELEQRCVDKMVQSVSAINACELINFAFKHKMTRLLLAILECIQNDAISVTEMRQHFALA